MLPWFQHPLPYALIGLAWLRLGASPSDGLHRLLLHIAVVTGVTGILLLGSGANERRGRLWIAGYAVALVVLLRVLMVLRWKLVGNGGVVCGWVLAARYGDMVWAGILPEWSSIATPWPFIDALGWLAGIWAFFAALIGVETLAGRRAWIGVERSLRLSLRTLPWLLLIGLRLEIGRDEGLIEFLSQGQLIVLVLALTAGRWCRIAAELEWNGTEPEPVVCRPDTRQFTGSGS